jgi:hypothetical protein
MMGAVSPGCKTSQSRLNTHSYNDGSRQTVGYFRAAEIGVEGEGSCPSKPDAGAAFALPPLENQFLVGLLDEGLEEPALDFETTLMDERLDLVGEMLVLIGHGQGHLQAQFE